MPLDTATVTHLHMVDGDHDAGQSPAAQPTVDFGADIGAALRAARTARGLSQQDVAEATRIRQSYVEAIEGLRLDELPSRPFTIGYVKAYANLLGLDGEAAVQRFKVDVPDDNEGLRAPVGVRRERDPRTGLILVGGCLIVAAILLWNVAQRAMAKEELHVPITSAQAAQQAVGERASDTGGNGAVSLGAPLPAPVESTTPAPYVTPGLAAAAAAGGSADAAGAALKERLALQKSGQGVVDLSDAPVLGAPFKAKGPMLGAPPAEASNIILQARKGASLVVRGADGSVYFARQLSPGEAFRAPRTAGLTADVSDPSAFDIFTGGVLTGRLTAAQTPFSRLVPAAPKAG
jgi:cytoskeleton protein RodZ